MVDIPKLLSLEKSNQQWGLLDINLQNIDVCKEYDTVEIDLIFYPYSEKITSDDYEVEPLQDHMKSAGKSGEKYKKYTDPYAIWFGSILWLVISTIAGVSNSRNVLEVESMVTLGIATYAWIEWWSKIESLLAKLTPHTRFQFKENSYRYSRSLYSTLGGYIQRHQNNRYQNPVLLPEKFDLIEWNNSYTVRMSFSKEDIAAVTENMARIATIRFKDKELAKQLNEYGFGCTMKLKLGNYEWSLLKRDEMIQTFENWRLWCEDLDHNFLENHFEWRRATSFWRFKKYVSNTYIEWNIIEVLSTPGNGHHIPNQTAGTGEIVSPNLDSTPPNQLQSPTTIHTASLTNSRVGKIVQPVLPK